MWLASNFSLEYNYQSTHWGHKNKKNDHQLKKLLIDKQILQHLRKYIEYSMETMHTDVRV